ncbi:MAG: hypothetical protein RBU29_11450, partial [bacterium]|nr:hypothetical protein [bacterium]
MKSIRTFLASIHAWLCLAGVGYGVLLLAARHPWLFERLEPIPPGCWGGWALLALPVLLWPGCADRGWRGYLYLVRIGQRAMISRPFWFFCAVFTLVPALCWVFRIQRVDSGDIYHFINFARQGKAFLVEHAPLESWLRCLLVDFSHWITPAADLLLEFKLLSCLYGALYVYVVLQGCRRLPRPYSILGPLFLLVTPNLALFCGYLEIYGPTVIALVFFLMVGLLFLYDR